jgi:hypothetical protein
MSIPITGKVRSFVGLNSFTNTVASAGIYNIQVECTVTPTPGHSSGGAGVGTYSWTPGVTSGATIIVTQNGTTVYTAPALTTHAKAVRFTFQLTCAANDAIVVALTSSTANDALANVIKTDVAINQFLLTANI